MRDAAGPVYPHPMGPHTPAPRTARWSWGDEFFRRLGIPEPAPLTAEHLADFERRNAEADAEAARLYADGQPAAA